ncbi:uncharacterized protein LOC114753731 [Neltuma alba]|uniref:uncharacterized protein LOC114753731 n=1 Tax=Neltuma alba TaxID=207710 RepID=UPI0010A2F49D|nr:uncharacterized protein LOC114753731 [Prosopis alba]
MVAPPSCCFLLHIAAALWLFSFFICATARSSRTFSISSYFFSLRRPFDDSNPTQTLSPSTHIRFFIPVYVVSNTDDKPSFSTEIFFDRGLPARPVEKELEIEPRASNMPMPFGFSSDDFSSLRGRTKDILSVIVALLFGVNVKR